MTGRAVLICGALLLVNNAAIAEQQPLPWEVSQVLQALNVSAQDVGVYVQALDSDQALITHNAVKSFNPASTIKLLTTWLALDSLGPAFTWPTRVYLDGELTHGVLRGDLIIHAQGDPYFTTERLWSLLRKLRLLGLQKIQGNLVIDNSYFTQTEDDPSAFDGEGLRVYNVLPDAALINFQALRLYFLPDLGAKQIRVVADPMPANLVIDNRLRAVPGPCGGFRNGVRLELEGSARDTLVVSGNYGIECDRYSLSRSVLTGPTFAYGLVRTIWESLDGELTGSLQLKPGVLKEWPEDAQPFLETTSPPLADVITYINKFSNNVMARHLFLTLAAERHEVPASVGLARASARELLVTRGFDFPNLYIDNGSGLSRDTRISAATLAAILRQAASGPWSAEYVSSLSLAGLDGTLQKRFKEEAATGRMHMKTGRLNDVFATAGYVHAQSGRDYVVVILQNYRDADRGPGEEAQSALLRWVHEQ